MAIKGNDPMYLMAERSGYESKKKKTKHSGWDSMTQVNLYHAMFDGMQARPYTAQLAGSPKARAKSGPRSLHAWQRDYNTKGLISEKPMTLRHQRVVKMKETAAKEAERRGLPTEVVEDEMYEAQRATSKRIDTGIRKDEMHVPTRTYPVGGGPPRLFDGSEQLEETFSLKDARDMFRGEAWEMMSETLSKLDEFKPPARPRTVEARKGDKRGSFSAGVSQAALARAQRSESPKAKERQALGAADIESLKKLLVRKYGSICAAWRHVLDLDGNGKLSFLEWCKGLRAVGFEGNIKGTYKQLDDDNSGIVTLNELEPELSMRIKDFRIKLHAKYGTHIDDMWRLIDENGNNQLDPGEFDEVCVNIGYEGNSMELFKQFRSHPSRKFLNKEDFNAIPKGY